MFRIITLIVFMTIALSSCNSGRDVTCKFNKEMKKSLSNIDYDQNIFYTEMNLSERMDFDWQQLAFFGEYATKEDILNETGLSWSKKEVASNVSVMFLFTKGSEKFYEITVPNKKNINFYLTSGDILEREKCNFLVFYKCDSDGDRFIGFMESIEKPKGDTFFNGNECD